MADSIQRRADAQEIFRSALAAADPGNCVRNALSIEDGYLRIGSTRYALDTISRLLVLGAGKATPAMAAAVEDILGEHIMGGSINTKYGHGHIEVVECGHPIPDANGVDGARRQLELLHNLDERALVICLFSGGGSALLPAPADGISLAEKQETTRLLLACGATIGEVNAIRKHLSAVKGGLLSRAAHPAQIASLMLSDVIGDPIDTIASGPTCPDSTTFSYGLELVERYHLHEQLPPAVYSRLVAGARGDIEETPKKGNACFQHVQNLVVGNNSLALDAATSKARELGYNTLVLTSRLQGEAREVAAALMAIAQETKQCDRPISQPACIISGGETTVTLRGKGKGGRNQEMALAAALHLDGWQGITFLSAGTDGTDGPTDATGAIVDGDSVRRGAECDLSARHYLETNDSYHYFQPLDDLIITGATGTNVMDLQIALVSSKSS